MKNGRVLCVTTIPSAFTAFHIEDSQGIAMPK